MSGVTWEERKWCSELLPGTSQGQRLTMRSLSAAFVHVLGENQEYLFIKVLTQQNQVSLNKDL